MAIATFDGPNKRILLTPPLGESTTSVLVGADLYSDWKEWVCLSDNSKYEMAMRATGGDDLGGGQKMGSYFFVQNQLGWKITPEHENSDLHVLELVGNLFPEDPNQGMFEFVQGTNVVVTMTRSVLTMVVTTGGSALTPDEHTRLFALPQATLETDERSHLLAIPTDPPEAGGLTQQEHDQLMAIPLTDTPGGLQADERAQLMALPTQTLEDDERNKLMALPEETLATDERAALLAVDGAVDAVAQEVAAVAGSVDAVASAVVALDTLVDAIKEKTDQLPGSIGRARPLGHFHVLMVQSTDHRTPATELVVSADLARDGGAFAPFGGTVVEIADGIYDVRGWTATDTDCESGTLRLTATGADTRYLSFVTSP